jgi:fatty acid desaturase
LTWAPLLQVRGSTNGKDRLPLLLRMTSDCLNCGAGPRQVAASRSTLEYAMDLRTLARRHAVAVRILVNTIYVAIIVWSISRGHWTYGLIVVPFLAYGIWRLLVLLRRPQLEPRTHQDSQRPDQTNL